MRRMLWAVALSALISLPAAAAEAPKVVASIKPIQSLVAQVMKGVGEPGLLVTGAASPHTFTMKPSDAKMLRDAKLVVWVGPDMETFLVKPLKAAGTKDLKLISAPGLTLLDEREGGVWEPHDHGHGAEEHHHDDDDHEVNAHLWLSPANAKAIVAAVADALKKIDPANATTYTANAEAESRSIDALDAELAKTLEPVKGKPFVVFHDAYQYLEARYDLNAVGSITVSPDRQPSAKRLAEIRGKLKTLGAVCVFSEPPFEPVLVDTLIQGTGARKGALDPEGALMQPGPDLYATLMRSNAKALVDCLM